jgi:hypothetical protein
VPIGCLGCGEGSKGALPIQQKYNDLQSALVGVKEIPCTHRATSIQQGFKEISIEKLDLGSGLIDCIRNMTKAA